MLWVCKRLLKLHITNMNSTMLANLEQMSGLNRVPTLPGKPGILSFTFPGLENTWNMLKKWGGGRMNFNSKPRVKM